VGQKSSGSLAKERARIKRILRHVPTKKQGGETALGLRGQGIR